MLVVAAATTLAMWLAQQGAEAAEQTRIQGEFRSAFSAQLADRRTQLESLADLCRALARKPRIIAALEEASVQDLYDNAQIELQLRGVIGGNGISTIRTARLHRFLDKTGAMIAPPNGRREPWETRLEQDGISATQTAGYVAAGDGSLLEVVTTPMIDGDTGEVFGAMVLCFVPRSSDGGVWIEGTLHLPGFSGIGMAEARQAIATVTASAGPSERSAPLEINGAPYLLFCQTFDSTHKSPAWHVALYPLAESIARQQALRWKIVSVGALILLGAYVAVHFLTARLSSPVEKLEVTSEVHRVGRERAEAALDLTNEELRARNTELAAAMDKLKAAQQQHVQQERLRALGQMASGVAHDFNNALVPILGFSDLLLMSPETLADPARARGYLQSIQTAASDAASVVARLREFYRSSAEVEKFTPVDLCKLVTQSVALTRPRWRDQALAGGATIELRTELDPVALIAGDEAALREVLTNLIFNAVDAMPQGGTITLRTRADGERVLLEISDTGTGMSEEVRCRCLEPFFSTKGERGTGLGLSMVFGIIQRHGGILDLQSELGKGTTFRISLPPHHEEQAKAAPAAEIQRGLRLLVVDDEEPVRETLAATLAHDGHIVTLAKHGVDGLRQFMAGSFDLVITDRAMPGMSGEQMAATMKHVRPQTPVILLTGFGQFLEKDRFPEVDVLASKPVSITSLREAIVSAMKT